VLPCSINNPVKFQAYHKTIDKLVILLKKVCPCKGSNILREKGGSISNSPDLKKRLSIIKKEAVGYSSKKTTFSKELFSLRR
jgi:hypothetical protein